jgi:protein-S-isoprenylcysteine O-methyltransferase Ste14
VLFTSVKPLPFVWPYALVFWAIYVWAFLPEWKIVRGGIEAAKHEESKDSGSIRVLLGGMWIALMLAFPLAFVRAWMFPRRVQLPLFAIGISMILLGSLLRRYCWRTLGEYFTGDVRARHDQPVINTGPYRLVRHPSYTAGMMMFIGIGLALGSWLSLVLLTLATIATYVYRVTVEERALLETIGEPYRVYCSERKRFVPYIV